MKAFEIKRQHNCVRVQAEAMKAFDELDREVDGIRQELRDGREALAAWQDTAGVENVGHVCVGGGWGCAWCGRRATSMVWWMCGRAQQMWKVWTMWVWVEGEGCMVWEACGQHGVLDLWQGTADGVGKHDFCRVCVDV